MKITRKNFLKLSGLAGVGMMIGTRHANGRTQFQKNHNQKFNMHGYAAPKLNTVRIGFIGIGGRGSGNVARYASIEGVEVKALCDVVPGRVNSSLEFLKTAFPQYNPDSYTDGPDDWKKVCERSDIDMICIGTPWHLHGRIAIYAMEHGKHVYVDIPVGVTVEECWQVVETSEKTRKHCFMSCMNCHGGIPAVLLNMVRQGYFGDLIHGEGHYIHDRIADDSRWVRDPDNNYFFGYRPWRLQENVNRNGNLYPQHGLGPLAQMMDLNYGDQMDYMVSISSNDFTMANKMREIAEIDDYYKPYVGLKFRGNINTSIIRTKMGRTLMLQHDISSPRPQYRFDTISGNKGIYSSGGRSRPDRIATSHDSWLPQEEYDMLIEKYTPKMTKVFREKTMQRTARRIQGVSYSSVYPEDWRFIDCLLNGLPVEMDVYDAALWSVITPLSEWSVAHEGSSVKVPDFTCGAWRTNKRGMDVSLKEGGTTNLL
jgi:hypothetical protein